MINNTDFVIHSWCESLELSVQLLRSEYDSLLLQIINSTDIVAHSWCESVALSVQLTCIVSMIPQYRKSLTELTVRLIRGMNQMYCQ